VVCKYGNTTFHSIISDMMINCTAGFYLKFEVPIAAVNSGM
jgi:hypothetical protein